MYGLTECKRVAYLPPNELICHPSSVGVPVPNEEVFIVDARGKEVNSGEVGELVVRGANVMQGYWNRPEETAAFRSERPEFPKLPSGKIDKKALHSAGAAGALRAAGEVVSIGNLVRPSQPPSLGPE